MFVLASRRACPGGDKPNGGKLDAKNMGAYTDESDCARMLSSGGHHVL